MAVKSPTPVVNYNTICPACYRRFLDTRRELGWIDLEKCPPCFDFKKRQQERAETYRQKALEKLRSRRDQERAEKRKRVKEKSRST